MTPEIIEDEYFSREVLASLLPERASEFLCPLCGCPLQYQGSRSTAGSECPLDLTDVYNCPAGCGKYEHERRTHRAHRLE